jgi:hypothetical protein
VESAPSGYLDETARRSGSEGAPLLLLWPMPCASHYATITLNTTSTTVPEPSTVALLNQGWHLPGYAAARVQAETDAIVP